MAKALIRSWSFEELVYYILMCIIGCSVLLSIYLESYIPFILPFAIVFIYSILTDYRRLFYLVFILLPFSTEVYFEGAGLGTDIPTEPLMIGLAFITIALLIKNTFTIHRDYVTHPIFLMMVVHVFWIFLTSLNSTYPLISAKWFAAKCWYILPFFILPMLFVKYPDDIQKAFRLLYKFLFVTICIVLVRHAFKGFSFTATYEVVRPFFRNHVAYAAISVLTLPFVWAFYRLNILKNISNIRMRIVFIIFVLGIYFSFTRAAILSMVIALGAWYIIKNKWVKQTLLVSSILATSIIVYLSIDNKYLDLTPNYERTIAHTQFDNLIEATYKLEDISSMERLYRWVSGVEMIKDKFWLGFGPGSFYDNYKSYSISRFQTYVSSNPDQSGIHNYFLMTWVEQGFIGFILFLVLCFLLLIEGERLYHVEQKLKDKYIIMATTLSLVIIFAMCLINDLIETDKVGPFFFFNAFILLYYSHKNKTSNTGNSNQLETY